MILPAHSYRKGKGPDNGLSQTYHMTAPGGVATATTPRPKTDRRNQPCSVLFASTFWLRGVWHSAVARASPGLILCARLIFGSGAFRTFFCSSIVSTNLQPPCGPTTEVTNYLPGQRPETRTALYDIKLDTFSKTICINFGSVSWTVYCNWCLVLFFVPFPVLISEACSVLL